MTLEGISDMSEKDDSISLTLCADRERMCTAKRAYHIRLFISGASHVVRLTIDAPEVNNPEGFCGVAANGDANRGHAYKALESAVPRGKRTQLHLAKP